MKQLLDPAQKREWEEYENNVERYRKALPLIQEIKRTQRQYQKNIELPSKGIIVFSGDWHIGHENFEVQLLEDHIELYKKYNMTVFCMGDLIENFNVRATFMKPSKAVLDLEEQKEMALKYLKSFKDQIGGIILGNHEERSLITDDHNNSKYWAKHLGVNYLGRWSRVNVKTPMTNFSLFLAHKWRGSSIYNIFHPCIRARMQQPFLAGTATICAIGHNHTPASQRTVNQINIRTGTYVMQDDYADSLGWGEMPNYIPCVVYEFDRIIPFTDLYEAIYYYEQITKGE